MRTLVQAFLKITTGIRPAPPQTFRPTEEIISMHVACCPVCACETRVALGPAATIFGSCPHFNGVEQEGDNVVIAFGPKN